MRWSAFASSLVDKFMLKINHNLTKKFFFENYCVPINQVFV